MSSKQNERGDWESVPIVASKSLREDLTLVILGHMSIPGPITVTKGGIIWLCHLGHVFVPVVQGLQVETRKGSDEQRQPFVL